MKSTGGVSVEAPPRGPAHPASFPNETALLEYCAAHLGAVDPLLAALVKAWPTMAPEQRDRLVAAVRAAAPAVVDIR
ncbi:hypothetical protein PLANPX_1557 [Lacipirellula parvula]|uniref:Uncharacterized protein n=1 Tax=Lacipirellula parvula TaxID=2650471 RepID=A0A5K7X6F6_9BACT|nr:hypothetical protein PLANPX_1557 [Lacipirellula parvula]